MLLFGERRKTSSECGVRVLWRWVRKECRERKVLVRRWAGERIYEVGMLVDWLDCVDVRVREARLISKTPR